MGFFRQNLKFLKRIEGFDIIFQSNSHRPQMPIDALDVSISLLMVRTINNEIKISESIDGHLRSKFPAIAIDSPSMDFKNLKKKNCSNWFSLKIE